MNNNGDNNKNEAYKMLAVCGQLGWMVAAPITISIFCGNWLDNYFGLSPVFILTGSVLGIAAAFRGIYSFIKKLDK